jgi:hypothetical protein
MLRSIVSTLSSQIDDSPHFALRCRNHMTSSLLMHICNDTPARVLRVYSMLLPGIRPDVTPHSHSPSRLTTPSPRKSLCYVLFTGGAVFGMPSRLTRLVAQQLPALAATIAGGAAAAAVPDEAARMPRSGEGSAGGGTGSGPKSTASGIQVSLHSWNAA